jgi:predicted hydrocarbon binding protein
MKITWNKVDAKELMYYDKEQSKFRMPLIEEAGALFPVHLFEALRSVLIKKFGHEMSNIALFDIGREHALHALKKFSNMLGGGKQSLAKKLFELGVNLDRTKKIFKSVYESQGWFKVIDMEFGRNNIFKLKYTFESIAYDNVYPCSFIEGYLAGMVEVFLLEKVIRHKELKCTSKGDDYCEFHIEVGSDIYQKFDFLLPQKTATD